MKKAIKLILTGIIMSAITATAYSAEVMGVDIHGFISQGYLYTTDNNYIAPTEDGSFEFNEFGINFSKEMTDKLRLGIQLFGKDLGPYGNDDIKIDWAFGDYRLKDWLGFRAGKLKTPHGLYNETRDVDMLRTWIFLPQSIYSEITRDTDLGLIGVGIYGNINMNKFGSLSYQGYVGTQNIETSESLAQALMGVTANDPSQVTAQNIDVASKYVAGLVWDTPLDGFRLSGTWSKAEVDLVSIFDFTADPFFSFLGTGTWHSDLSSETMVFSAEYTWNDLLLVAEYMRSDRELTINELSPTPSEFKPDGWYLGASYRFNDWFELGGYYSEYYLDRNNRDGEGGAYDPTSRAYLKDVCLTTRFNINEYCAIKLEGHMFTGTGSLSPVENPIPTDGSEQWVKDWQMVAAKVTFSF